MTARFMKFTASKLFLAIIASSVLTLGACNSPAPLRHEVAQRIASPAWMVKRPIETGLFTLTAYERMHERNEPVNIYIEGEGVAQRNNQEDTPFNPTPTNPVGLHLSAMDKANNVAYISRPCQYQHMTHYDHPLPHAEECAKEFFGDKRFSSEVITAYHSALDNIERQYGTNGFHLIGYDGGGAIAAILAAQRDDVLSLRTVAGNLDHDAQSADLGLPLMTGSLNAIDYVADLRDVPQHHFIGGQDETVRPIVLNSYLQALGPSPCVDYTMIQEAENERGWVEKWPGLLKLETPVCKKAIEPLPPLEIKEPIFVPRMSGDKK